MKAENILNSNLASKIQFVMKKFAKNEFSKIFVSFLTAFFFFETQNVQQISVRKKSLKLKQKLSYIFCENFS